MILLLFHPQYINLFNLMDINITICLHTWLKHFKICILNLWLQVDAKVVELEVTYLLYHHHYQEVKVKVDDSTIFLKTLLRIMLL